jgi:hypothetical protein
VELPTSSCHRVLYPRYYGLIGNPSSKPPEGSRGVVLLSPRVGRDVNEMGTRDWYHMNYITPSVTGGQKHTQVEIFFESVFKKSKCDCRCLHF